MLTYTGLSICEFAYTRHDVFSFVEYMAHIRTFSLSEKEFA